MAYRYLDVRRDGAVEYLTLNRPDVRNALNDEVGAELTAWAAAARRAAVASRPEGGTARQEDGAEAGDLRVVVLAGAGASFCAGADIGWMSRALAYSTEDNIRDATAMAEMFDALNTLPVPVIGRIHGAALGGGCGLAAICDIVVADEQALFGFTETKLGILPSMISPFAIAKIGVGAARELFLTGARFSAARAQAIGLVNVVVPAAALDETVQQYVRELLTAGPHAIARAKALIPQVVGRAPADVRALTSRTIAEQRVSPEGEEGLRAFLEKRKPSWIGTS
jgi:methylglutaconyl-CoA hydratase